MGLYGEKMLKRLFPKYEKKRHKEIPSQGFFFHQEAGQSQNPSSELIYQVVQALFSMIRNRCDSLVRLKTVFLIGSQSPFKTEAAP
jgi:hypothetical protein